MRRVIRNVDNRTFLPFICETAAKYNRPVTILARGNSMRPFIEDCRDKLTLGISKEYKVNDVALAEVKKGIFILHRIIKIDGDKVTMQGDGNPITTTEHCELKDLRAKLVAVERNGKVWRTDGRTWKLYTAFWTHTRFARRYMLAIYRRIIDRKKGKSEVN